jgi:hypothetical protein
MAHSSSAAILCPSFMVITAAANGVASFKLSKILTVRRAPGETNGVYV